MKHVLQDVFFFISNPSFLCRRISKKRSKSKIFPRLGVRRRSKVTFTTTDIFTHILRGWVDEFIDLGANEKLNDIVFALYARYVRKEQSIYREKKGISFFLQVVVPFQNRLRSPRGETSPRTQSISAGQTGCHHGQEKCHIQEVLGFVSE